MKGGPNAVARRELGAYALKKSIVSVARGNSAWQRARLVARRHISQATTEYTMAKRKAKTSRRAQVPRKKPETRKTALGSETVSALG